VDLTFRVSGPITELPVLKGQTIQEGDLLAQIDPRDYQTNLSNTQSALDNAKAQLKAMKEGSRSEEIAVLKANLGSAQSQMAEAKANYERYKALVKQGAVSEAEFEKFQTSYQVAQSQVKAAQEQLKQGKAGARQEDLDAMESTIQGLEASVKSAQDALDDTKLFAPFDGRISDRFVEQYQNVSAGQPILHVQDIFSLDIVVNVPESDLARSQAKDIKVQSAATFDSLPGQTFPLTIKEISTQADPDSQTYPVTLTMGKHEDLNILPGMITDVDVAITLSGTEQEGPRSWPVPVEAVFIDNQGLSHIWKIDSNTGQVHSVQVQIHNYSGDEVFISGDILSGDLVVSAGTSYLTENDKVRVIEGRIGK
jgi:RND family efflux transporter MFP subunit